MIDSGLIDKWMESYWPENKLCTLPGKRKNIKHSAVMVKDIQGICLLLFIGVTLAAFLLLLETIFRFKKIN